MRRIVFSAALVLLLVTGDMATAQFRGGGVRIGGGGWGGYGGGFGGYGGSVRVGGVSASYGTWGSPYGYGYGRGFGGYGRGLGYGYGGGWGGYYGGNRAYFGAPNMYYAQPSFAPNYAMGPSIAAPVATPVMMTVMLPKADAEVLVNDTVTTSKGTERWFESRPLQPGVTYTYTLKAKWMEKGKTVEMTREVPVTAGGTFEIDFRKPAN